MVKTDLSNVCLSAGTLIKICKKNNIPFKSGAKNNLEACESQIIDGYVFLIPTEKYIPIFKTALVTADSEESAIKEVGLGKVKDYVSVFSYKNKYHVQWEEKIEDLFL